MIAVDVNHKRGTWLFSSALMTLTALAFAFAALDDITTDAAASFRSEYAALTVCAAWLALLSVLLVRVRLRALGVVSLIALAAALWGQRRLAPQITPALTPASVVTIAAFAWFLTLSFVLLVVGWRAMSPRARL